ncbi:unnamed protein product [Closterium sp. Naga37s-1]|nr:unnamed protein product [Closterium sp. Naga37s-1]
MPRDGFCQPGSPLVWQLSGEEILESVQVCFSPPLSLLHFPPRCCQFPPCLFQLPANRPHSHFLRLTHPVSPSHTHNDREQQSTRERRRATQEQQSMASAAIRCMANGAISVRGVCLQHGKWRQDPGKGEGQWQQQRAEENSGRSEQAGGEQQEQQPEEGRRGAAAVEEGCIECIQKDGSEGTISTWGSREWRWCGLLSSKGGKNSGSSKGKEGNSSSSRGKNGNSGSS